MTDTIKYTSQHIDNLGFDENYKEPTVLPVEEQGGTLVRKQNDPLDGYKITEINGAYFGFTKVDGSWYILWNNSGAWRYLKGSADFSTAWTNRIGAGYDYFYNIF